MRKSNKKRINMVLKNIENKLNNIDSEVAEEYVEWIDRKTT